MTRHHGGMAMPPQIASLLSKVALSDVGLGLVLALVGLLVGPGFLIVVGLALVACGGGMLALVRSQRTEPEGPIGGGPIS